MPAIPGARCFVLGVQDRRVERLFAGKMPEYDGFGDAGRGRDFPGGSAVEPLAREKLHGRVQQPPPPVAGVQAARRVSSFLHAQIVSQYLLTGRAGGFAAAVLRRAVLQRRSRTRRFAAAVLQPLYTSATISRPAFRSMSAWNRFGHIATST